MPCSGSLQPYSMGHGLMNTNCVYLAPTCCKGHCLMQSTTCSTRHRDLSLSPTPRKQLSFIDPSHSSPEKTPFGQNLNLSVSFCKLSKVNKEKRNRNIATGWSKRGKTLKFTHTKFWSTYLVKAFCLDSRYFLIYNGKTGLPVTMNSFPFWRT